jgi:hypothetical protein
MDLYKIIQDLYVEKGKLERVIASLEELQRAAGGSIPPAPDSGKRRGRKSLGPEERSPSDMDEPTQTRADNSSSDRA